MKKVVLSLVFACVAAMLFAQGSETFTNAPNSGSYTSFNWTGDNGLQWNATDARTDQNMNGRAATIREGSVKCNAIPNGINSLSFNHQQFFGGSGGILEVRINNNVVATVNPTTTLGSFTISGLNIQGAFNLEIAQTNTNNLRIGVDDITWTAFSFPCTAPPAVAALVVNSNTSTTVDGSYSTSSGATGYLVVRSTSATLSATPANGTTYNAGDAFGGGIIIQTGTALSFYDDGLTPSTQYYYHVYAYAHGACVGPVYAAAIVSNTTTQATPACVTPSGVISNLQLSPTSSTISATFDAATGANAYLVVRSTSSTIGFTPVNGTTYTVGQAAGSGTVIKFSNGNTFLATGLAATTTYYFHVFAASAFDCSGGPLFNTTAVSASAATNAIPPTDWPTTYYDFANGKTCAALKTAIRQIIDNSTGGFTGDTYKHNPQSYDALWNQYKITDIKPREVGSGSANVIWDIYSDNPTGNDPYNFTPGTNQCGNYSGEGICYNREHSFPKSWFNDAAPMHNDYHHVYPTDGSVNGMRSNYKFGEVASATKTSQNGSKLGSSAVAGVTGPVFEPINEYKGDMARAYLYMVTRYETNLATWNGYGTDGAETLDGSIFPAVEIPYLKLMIKWHTQDPVSAKERARNNGGYSFQGNRNPFVDHPEYVGAIWNSSCPGLSTLPVDVIFFTGKLNGNYVDLKWEVENEINLSHYEVERSFNGTEYSTIGEVKATNASAYNYKDDIKNYTGRRVYYRLKKTDKDGNYKYSEVFTLHISLNVKFSVYPNPAKDAVKIQINNNLNEKVQIQITDVMGKVVMSAQQTPVNGLINLSLNNITSGLYFIKMNINGEIFSQKLTVVK